MTRAATAASISSPEASPRRRLESIDVVRGLIMIVMAIDHTRDYFGIPGPNPTNLATTHTAAFLTRWITHICAPTFFLLTGTGAWLAGRRLPPAQLSRFLLTRGLWLIVLEIGPVKWFAYQFNFDYRVTLLIVLWALGWSMIVLAGLVHLRASMVTAIGLLLIVGHNLFDGIRSANPIWLILHAPGFVLPGPEHAVFVSYPLIPWIGVTAAGYGLGQIYGWEAARRRSFLLRLGGTMVLAFLVLRWLNVYGDAAPWAAQATPLFTVLSFVNTTKYPPSLLFLLMTLGPVLILLSALDGATPRLLRPALTIGKVPLFYYGLHFALIHLLAVVTCYVRFGSVHWLFESPDLAHFPFSPPPGWGFSLPGVYLMWVVVVLLMYPLCRWFAGVKQRRHDAWLSYL